MDECFRYHINCSILAWPCLGPGEVIAPVHHIEQEKASWKQDPGKHIYLLGLELEPLEPVSYNVPPPRPHGDPVVMQHGCWGDHVSSLDSPHQRILQKIYIIFKFLNLNDQFWWSQLNFHLWFVLKCNKAMDWVFYAVIFFVSEIPATGHWGSLWPLGGLQMFAVWT